MTREEYETRINEVYETFDAAGLALEATEYDDFDQLEAAEEDLNNWLNDTLIALHREYAEEAEEEEDES